MNKKSAAPSTHRTLQAPKHTEGPPRQWSRKFFAHRDCVIVTCSQVAARSRVAARILAIDKGRLLYPCDSQWMVFRENEANRPRTHRSEPAGCSALSFGYFLRTSVFAIMSWSACLRAVKATMRYPIPRMRGDRCFAAVPGRRVGEGAQHAPLNGTYYPIR